MKKIILFILLITPLFAFGKTELKPAPINRTDQTEEATSTSGFKRIFTEPEYLVGIGAILTALVTLWHSNRSIKVAREESKRQYEIAQRQMTSIVIQEWINEFRKSLFEFYSYVIDLLDKDIDDKENDTFRKLLISDQKIHSFLDWKNPTHFEFAKALENFRKNTEDRNIANEMQKKLMMISLKIIQEQWDRIAKYDNEPSL